MTLAPGQVLTAYPGLTGTLDPNDLYMHLSNPFKIRDAIALVVNHAIQSHSAGAVYDFFIAPPFSGKVIIGFLRAFEPAGPHVFIAPGTDFSYSPTGQFLVSSQSDGAWTVGFRSSVPAEYESPCGIAASHYRVVLVNDQNAEPLPLSFAFLYQLSHTPATCGEGNVVTELDCGPPLVVNDGEGFIPCE